MAKIEASQPHLPCELGQTQQPSSKKFYVSDGPAAWAHVRRRILASNYRTRAEDVKKLGHDTRGRNANETIKVPGKLLA